MRNWIKSFFLVVFLIAAMTTLSSERSAGITPSLSIPGQPTNSNEGTTVGIPASHSLSQRDVVHLAQETDGSPDPQDDLGSVIEYNLETGETTIIEIQPMTAEPAEPIPPQPGFLPEVLDQLLEGERGIIGEDDRIRITPTTSYPYITMTKLFMTFPGDPNPHICSGAIIDAYHVLTAGHCIFNREQSLGWASVVRVVPGMDETVMPVGEAFAEKSRTYTHWTDDGNVEHDWALLTLDRNIGNFTGSMGRATFETSNSKYTGYLNTAGYPCNFLGGTCTDPVTPVNTLWSTNDNGCSATENLHYVNLDFQPGQSGSPIWYYDGTNRFILSILTYFNTSGCSCCNYGTRLNSDKYNMINTWIAEDTPPTDIADLTDDEGSNGSFDPYMVKPGSTTFLATSSTRNIGTANSGSFNVAYYASADQITSQTDYMIGLGSRGVLTPYSSGTTGIYLTFPTHIPDGRYYLGWIIDSSFQVTEFREDNNTGINSSERFCVDSSAPTNPNNILSNSHQLETWSTDPTIDISTCNGAYDAGTCGWIDGYSTIWSTSSTTLPNTTMNLDADYCTSQSPQLYSSKNWYFHVRTVDLAGNWSGSAAHYGPFYIDVDDPSNPDTITSSSHQLSTWSPDTTVDISWSGASDHGHSGIAGYSFSWTKSPNTLPDTAIDTTKTSTTSPQLGVSDSWYFHIRTRDAVGNWNPVAKHFGPFYIDPDLPSENNSVFLPLINK